MSSTLLFSEVQAIDKNRVNFMNGYYKETEKQFGYLLVDNKPDTPPDKQVLADLFGKCYVYHFAVNSTEPTCVETSTTPVTKTKPARKLQVITWLSTKNILMMTVY